MARILFLITLLSVSGFTQSAPDFYAENKALKFLEKTLKVEELELGERIDFTDVLGEGRQLVAYPFSYPGKPEKYFAVFTESKGRYDMFDYLVITDVAGEIRQVKVLKYRSEHGGEIASKKWLSQFEHYKGGDLYYEEEISAISGATISAMSITRDIPKVVNIIQSYSEN